MLSFRCGGELGSLLRPSLATLSLRAARPEPKIRLYLHSVPAASGHCVVYLRVGVGEKRPVRQASGYALHPTCFNAQVPHTRKGADKPWQVLVYRLRGA